MSILIKGMEMPKSCAECERWSICKCLNDFEDYESICYAVEDGDLVRDANCPLIELPPHGRLIDVDEFEKYVELEYETREISHPNWIKFRVWCGDQPTIIEAEE